MKQLGVSMIHSKQAMDTSEGAASAGSDGAMKETQGVQAGKQLQSNASTRRLSAESQDFEFNKLGDIVSPYNARDQNQAGVQLASADELFYKGQLLPLQYNNAWSHHHLHSNTNSTIAATSSISSPYTHELPFEPLSSQLISREQDVRFSSSCRMDNQNLGLDSSVFDFRCSSFRSHSSKYSSYYCNYYANYGSNSNCSSNSSRESSTTGGESSSSSRDSNGSSQDSACYSYPDHTHMTREHYLCSCSCHGHSAHPPNGPHHCPKRKQGFIQSWKLLIQGFKRGSSHDHQVHHKSSKFCNIQGPDLRASSAELNHIHSPSLAANQGSLSSTCGCKAQSFRRGHNSNVEKPRSSTGQLKACEKEGFRTQLSAEINQGPVSEVKKAPSTIINGASNHSAGISSKWQGYTKRIKPISIIKARLVGTNHGQENMSKGGTQSAARATEEERGRRVTRKLSLDRKFSQPSLCDSSMKGLSNLQVSFQFHAVSSSCPASVRSSPNHSGLLSPPSTTMSTMQELHSAVQGAIAHCKQSNSAHIVAHTPSS